MESTEEVERLSGHVSSDMCLSLFYFCRFLLRCVPLSSCFMDTSSYLNSIKKY